MGLQDAVLAANEAFYRAFNQKDVALMEDVWSEAAGVSCVHPGWNVLEGREAVLGSWRDILGNPNQARIVTGGATVHIYGALALVICRELVGGSPLVASNVFALEGEAWKLLHHHSGPVFTSA
ncbi:MAG TPA: nuclear transport factor 2 family protein [Dehalococcoidia bacterium]|nr:nuclear transport factor 2 family protein [Dehalococcoidia bacterium]